MLRLIMYVIQSNGKRWLSEVGLLEDISPKMLVICRQNPLSFASSNVDMCRYVATLLYFNFHLRVVFCAILRRNVLRDTKMT